MVSGAATGGPEAIGGVFAPARRALTAGLLVLVSTTAFEALAVATAMPAAAREIGGLAAYGWAFSAFSLASLLGIALAGRSADREGPAAPFAAATAAFVAGLVVAGAAPSMPVLIAGRAVQGLGGGALAALATAAIARGYPEAQQPRMLALISSAWVLPGLLGPGAAAMIAEHAGWRFVFLGLAPFSALSGAVTAQALRGVAPAARAQGAAPDRTLQALQLAAGGALLFLGLGRAARAAGLALVALGAALALPALLRLLPPGTLRLRRGLPAAVATIGLTTFAFFGAETYLPLAATSLHGESTAAAGALLTASALCWTAGAWVQARLAERLALRAQATLGLVALCAGIVFAALLAVPGTSLALSFAGWAVGGLGMGVAYSSAMLAVLRAAEAGAEGEASASLQLANMVATAAAAGLGGAWIALLGSGEGPTSLALLAQSACALAGACAALAAAQRGGAVPR